jgi:hypothetical protein
VLAPRWLDWIVMSAPAFQDVVIELSPQFVITPGRWEMLQRLELPEPNLAELPPPTPTTPPPRPPTAGLDAAERTVARRARRADDRDDDSPPVPTRIPLVDGGLRRLAEDLAPLRHC